MDLWVVGGEQKPMFLKRESWRGFQRAVVVRVEGGAPRRVFEYVSPPEHAPEEPSPVFTAATFTDKTAYLCTSTEVLVCDLPDFTVRRVISHHCFNDLHHVALSPSGTLYVAVTGLDAVAELTQDGEMIRLVSVVAPDVWDRFSRDIDYRRVPTTKPHRAHPNQVFFLDGEPWVTRFEQRDIVPLADIASAVPLHDTGLHDGFVRNGEVFFTAVDGHILRLCRRTWTVSQVNLAPLSPSPSAPLGWCRGLLPVDDNRAWVGFTRLRYTRLRRNLSWVRHPLQATEHAKMGESRIALYSLHEPRLLDQVGLEDVGMHAIYSIHPADAH
jgi:hypothetical protein